MAHEQFILDLGFRDHQPSGAGRISFAGGTRRELGFTHMFLSLEKETQTFKELGWGLKPFFFHWHTFPMS